MKHTDKPTTTASASQNCAHCGSAIHFSDKVWLDATKGEGCTDDNGNEQVHAPKASATPDKVRELNPIFGKGLHIESKHEDAKELARLGIAYGDKRTIPAEKPTDAPNYHVETELRAQAAQLAEALRDLADVIQRIGPPAISQGGLCEEQDWATATRKATQAMAAYEAGK